MAVYSSSKILSEKLGQKRKKIVFNSVLKLRGVTNFWLCMLVKQVGSCKTVHTFPVSESSKTVPTFPVAVTYETVPDLPTRSGDWTGTAWDRCETWALPQREPELVINH